MARASRSGSCDSSPHPFRACGMRRLSTRRHDSNPTCWQLSERHWQKFIRVMSEQVRQQSFEIRISGRLIYLNYCFKLILDGVASSLNVLKGRRLFLVHPFTARLPASQSLPKMIAFGCRNTTVLESGSRNAFVLFRSKHA